METKLQEIAYNQVGNISKKSKNKINKSDIFESIFKSLKKELNTKKDEILALNTESKKIKKDESIFKSSEKELNTKKDEILALNTESKKIKKDEKEIPKKIDTNKDIFENSANLGIVNFSLKIQYDKHIKNKENKSQNITNLNHKPHFNNQEKIDNKISYGLSYIDKRNLDLEEKSIKKDIKVSNDKRESESILQNLEEILPQTNNKTLQNIVELSQNLPKEQNTLNKSKNINNSKEEASLNTNLYGNKSIEIKKNSLKQELDSKFSEIQLNEKHNKQYNNFINTMDLKDVLKNIENKQENSYLLSDLQQSDNKTKEDIKTINNIDNKDNIVNLDKSANINTLIELKEGYESNNHYNQYKENTENFVNRTLSNQSNFNFSYNQTNITASITQNTLNMLINTKDIVIDYNMISEIQNILEKNGFRNSNLVIKDKEKVIKIYKDEFRDSKNYGLNIEV